MGRSAGRLQPQMRSLGVTHARCCCVWRNALPAKIAYRCHYVGSCVIM